MICSIMLRALFRAVLLLGFFWLLYVGIVANHETTMITRITIQSTGSFKHWKLVGRERHPIYQKSDLHYISKRRVPNGPDPIHNRRASQARQPPGRA